MVVTFLFLVKATVTYQSLSLIWEYLKFVDPVSILTKTVGV